MSKKQLNSCFLLIVFGFSSVLFERGSFCVSKCKSNDGKTRIGVDKGALVE
jgi:hypothetical protein